MSIATDPTTEQLIAELYKIDGKAEIVDGRIVQMSPTRHEPGCAGGAIFVSLHAYAKHAGGVAFPDNVGFLTDLPRRKSFCPDAAYYTGPHTGMKFPSQAPDFAVEVRSEGDYGPQAEQEIAAKRAEYFAAGTKVVWDVDLLSDDMIRVYNANAADNPTILHRGEYANAEPAVPGWLFAVDELFD
jgi:Uma2 family endonuclease